LLHGVNAIVKGDPWVPSTSWNIDTSLSTKDFITLQQLGVNVIRLGVMWPGVEPVRGQYNSTYLDKIQSIVETAAKYGIYSLLDMHQDVLSEKFCGEGVPAWAADTTALGSDKQFPVPLESNPYTNFASDGFPTRDDCNKHGWASYYNTNVVGAAFEALYQNKDGVHADDRCLKLNLPRLSSL
jgi:endoglycosylceramidase